jgi:hypothetical protein
VIPGPIPAEMIVATSRPMGIKLLQQMGWKEGQGIGSRKKRKMRDGKDLQIDLHGIQELPAEVVSGGEILFSAVDEISGKLSEIPKPKLDKYGIGFNQPNEGFLGMGSGQDLVSFNRWNTSSSLSSSIDIKIGSGSYRVGDIFSNASNSGFENKNLAVGKLGRSLERDNGGFALDDDEDDVYENSHTSVDYSQVSTYSHPTSKLHNEVQLSFKKEHVPLLTMSTGEGAAAAFVPLRCKTDNKLPLPGFHVSEQYLHCTAAMTAAPPQSSSQEFQMVYFPPPVVPRDFTERHDFLKDRYLPSAQKETSIAISELKGSEGMEGTKLAVRGRLYEMLDAKGKEQINRALALQSNVSQQPSSRPSLPVAIDSHVTSNSAQSQPFAAPGLAEALKGRFMSSATIQASPPSGLSKPLGGLVSAQDLELERKRKEENELRLNPPKDQSKGDSLLKSIRRTTTIWAPNRLLCKRMNVPVPQITTDRLAVTTQVVTGTHGREAEIFEKHIEKHISSNSFLQLPSMNTEESESSASLSSATAAAVDGKQTSSGGTGTRAGGAGAEGGEVFQLEDSIDPTTGIFIPEIKPQLSLLKSIFDDSESESESEDESEEEREKEREEEKGKGDASSQDFPQDTPLLEEGTPPTSVPLGPPQEQQPKGVGGFQDKTVVAEVTNGITPNAPTDEVATDTRLVFRKPTSRGASRGRAGSSSQSKPKPIVISFDDEEGDGEELEDSLNLKILRSRREDALKSVKKISSPSVSSVAPDLAAPPAASPPITATPSQPMRTQFSQHSSQSNQKTLERLKRSLETQQHIAGAQKEQEQEQQEDGSEEEEEKKRRKKGKTKKKSKKSKKESKGKNKRDKSRSKSRSERDTSRGRTGKKRSRSSSMSSSTDSDSEED